MRPPSRVTPYGPQVGNSTNRRADGPMSRTCPRCAARPSWRCIRYVGERQTALKGFHAERRTPRQPSPEQQPDA